MDIYNRNALFVSILQYHIGDRIGWVRIFGKGIHWKDPLKHRLLFSERNGYRKSITIFGFRVSLLK